MLIKTISNDGKSYSRIRHLNDGNILVYRCIFFNDECCGSRGECFGDIVMPICTGPFERDKEAIVSNLFRIMGDVLNITGKCTVYVLNL